MKRRACCFINVACGSFLCAVLLFGASVVTKAQLVNGNFETGDFTGWTLFTDTNGDTGNPAVVLFDTTGNGASYCAQFEVGSTADLGDADGHGGGIMQSVTLGAGRIQIHADIAAYKPGSVPNISAGNFELIFDGNVVATNFLGMIDNGQTIRSNLNCSLTVAAGTHEFAVAIRRAWLNNSNDTPYEYIDNITLTESPLPAPIPLNIQRRGSSVILTWTNSAFSLQAASSPSGIFTNVSGAISPYTNMISGPAQYFRLLAN